MLLKEEQNIEETSSEGDSEEEVKQAEATPPVKSTSKARTMR